MRERSGWTGREAQRRELDLPPSPRGRPRRIAVGIVRGTFVTDYPWVASEWHPTLNDGMDPASVPAGRNVDYWWKCPYGPEHEFEATPHNRIQLGNGDLTPYDVTFGSHQDVWWTCPTGYTTHDYPTMIRSRTNTLSGCPKCANKRRPGGMKRRPRPRTTKPPIRIRTVLRPEDLDEQSF